MKLEMSFMMTYLVRLISGIYAEAATDYTAVSLNNPCLFFSRNISFSLRHASQGFTVFNVLLVYLSLFSMSAWLMLDKHISSIVVCMHLL